jgi:DNA-binding LytR/AlgR family response regulator
LKSIIERSRLVICLVREPYECGENESIQVRSLDHFRMCLVEKWRRMEWLHSYFLDVWFPTKENIVARGLHMDFEKRTSIVFVLILNIS